MKNEHIRKSQISIFCKDGSRRVIVSEGAYSTISATELGKDLEGDNFKYVTVSIL